MSSMQKIITKRWQIQIRTQKKYPNFKKNTAKNEVEDCSGIYLFKEVFYINFTVLFTNTTSLKRINYEV
jgi:hypothetical protein